MLSPRLTLDELSLSVTLVRTLVRVMAGLPVTGVTTVLLLAGPVSLESALPVLVTLPAVTSAPVTVYEPDRTQVAPTATLAQVALAGVSSGSPTTTLVSVLLPVLVAVTV